MKELNFYTSRFLPDISEIPPIPEIPDEPFDVNKISKMFASHIVTTFRRNLDKVFRYRDTPNNASEFPWEGEHNIKQHVNNCKWVPKLYINLMQYIEKQFNGRELEHQNKWNLYVKLVDEVFKNIESEPFKRLIKNDGLIITSNDDPLNKYPLVKIKPKKEMTIDLEYAGDFLFQASDMQGDNLKELTDLLIEPEFISFLKTNPSLLTKNHVYRCYPNESSLFSPREEREPGKRGNGYVHCLEIQRLHKTYFNLSELEDIYKFPPWYGQNNGNIPHPIHLYEFSQEIYKAYISFMVEKYNNDNQASILDIGCGSAGQYANQFENWTGG
jgi:hypothetical protein